MMTFPVSPASSSRPGRTIQGVQGVQASQAAPAAGDPATSFGEILERHVADEAPGRPVDPASSRAERRSASRVRTPDRSRSPRSDQHDAADRAGGLEPGRSADRPVRTRDEQPEASDEPQTRSSHDGSTQPACQIPAAVDGRQQVLPTPDGRPGDSPGEPGDTISLQTAAAVHPLTTAAAGSAPGDQPADSGPSSPAGTVPPASGAPVSGDDASGVQITAVTVTSVESPAAVDTDSTTPDAASGAAPTTADGATLAGRAAAHRGAAQLTSVPQTAGRSTPAADPAAGSAMSSTSAAPTAPVTTASDAAAPTATGQVIAAAAHARPDVPATSPSQPTTQAPPVPADAVVQVAAPGADGGAGAGSDDTGRSGGKPTGSAPAATPSSASPAGDARTAEANTARTPGTSTGTTASPSLRHADAAAQAQRDAQIRRAERMTQLGVDVTTEGLGAIHVEATSGSGGLHLNLAAERASTQHLLDEHAGVLRDELGGGGVQVDVGRQRSGDNGHRATGDTDRRAGGAARRPSAATRTDTPDRPALRALLADRGLDLHL